MAFLAIELFNFKTHKETKVEFKDAETILSGPNGVGKTSVLEGVIWALTGKDLEGNGEPKRYIALGADRSTVILKSPKFLLQRTISRKSSQQVKIMLSGWDRYEPVTQEELDKKFGADFRKFSSIINVGFFMKQSPRDRRDILRSFVNTGSLRDIVSEIIGEPAPDISNIPYLDQKKDLKTLTAVRIQKEKELAATKAALHEQRSVLETYKQEGDLDVLSKRKVVLEKQIRGVEEFHKLKRTYEYELSNYDSEKRRFEEATKSKESLANELEIASANLDTVTAKEKHMLGLVKTIEAEKPAVDYMPMPEKPSLVAVPTNEFCQTCGQKITDRTKLAYETRRKEAVAAYDAKMAEVNAFNLKSQRLEHEWRTKVIEAQAEAQKYSLSAHQIQMLVVQLQAKFDQFKDAKEPTLPRAPQSSLSTENYDGLRQQLVETSGQIQMIIATQTRREQCIRRVSELEDLEKKVNGQVYFYTKMEDAFKKVPGYELGKIRSAAEIQGYELIVLEKDGEPEGIDYSYKGVPWLGLSEGEKIRLSCLVSERLSKLMVRPDGSPLLEFFFVDNHELLDSHEVIEGLPGQRIIAKVDPRGWMVV